MHSKERMKILMATASLVLLLHAAGVPSEVSFRASVDRVEIAYEAKVLLDLEVTVTDARIVTKPLAPPTMLGFRIGGSVSSVTQSCGKHCAAIPLRVDSRQKWSC